MIKLRQIHVGVLTGVLLLSMAGVSAAQGGEGRHQGQPPSEKEFIQEEKNLGLSKEQRAQMKALRQEFKAKRQALRAEIKSKRTALRQELDGANPDRAKAEAIVKELGVLDQQSAMERVDHVLKIRTILSPEQFQKLQKLHEKKMGERGTRKRHHSDRDDNKDEPGEK